MNTKHSPDVIAPAAANRRVIGNRVLVVALLAGGFALAGVGMATAYVQAAPSPAPQAALSPAPQAALSPAPQVDPKWCWTWDVDRSAVAACRSSDPPQA